MPTVFRRASAVRHIPPLAEGLVPLENAPRNRKVYGATSDIRPEPHGRVYTLDGVYSQIKAPPMPDSDNLETGEEEMADETHNRVDKRNKKDQRLWRKWSEDTIPSLLMPYVEMMRLTTGLRDMTLVRRELDCGGCANGRPLKVSCIFFERIENLTLCNCTEPALQLLRRGFFPCAPSAPSLAVDLNVLDFAQQLFVNAAPNTTAWCETLEGFLSSRKFKLKTRNSLRARFGNAMKWYSCLTNTKNLLMRDYLDRIRGEVFGNSIGVDIFANDDNNHRLVDPTPDTVMKDLGSDTDGAEGDNPMRNRPSQYLRERCPLCFGGENWSKPGELVDAIVCVDACFTQKRRKSQGSGWSPPHIHPQTVFIPEDEVKVMEDEVERIRPTLPKGKKQSSNPQEPGSLAADSELDYEPGIKVPVYALDGCNESFAAADEQRAKASTLFFADTGLMGLLCRHDRVLWLVNMTSAGEKQHYALALIKKLFEHIPDTMRIGLLYDIGCQLNRSCLKHGFLEEFLDRIVFGISVFHAYGHQWPCQIIYHPRKCEGFGLSDGEGCERFWSMIKALIPSCRVSGYYTRLYTIDTKIKQLDETSLFGLGNWLKRKWLLTQKKKHDAQEILDVICDEDITMDVLEAEWKAQITEQSKPLKRQSKLLANKALEEIIILMQNLEQYKKDEAEAEEMMHSGEYDPDMSPTLAQELVNELGTKIKKTKKAIEQKRGQLSVDGRLNLKNLMDNEFLRIRMNALALKQRIRDRLRARKFEIENLERSYRSSVNQAKLEKHAQQQIKKKEPGIQTLARNYNKLCKQLEELLQQKKAPRGARSPLLIEMDGLFKLDVDDEIWQDIGLTDDNDDDGAIPDWLGNDTIRYGIKIMLEYDRCNEEEYRLVEEKISMCQWFREEWAIVVEGLRISESDDNIIYQLQERKHYLLRLYLSWKPNVSIIPDKEDQDHTGWGPSEEDISIAKHFEETENSIERDDFMIYDDNSNGELDDSDEEGFNWEDGESDIDDAELLDDMEIDFLNA